MCEPSSWKWKWIQSLWKPMNRGEFWTRWLVSKLLETSHDFWEFRIHLVWMMSAVLSLTSELQQVWSTKAIYLFTGSWVGDCWGSNPGHQTISVVQYDGGSEDQDSGTHPSARHTPTKMTVSSRPATKLHPLFAGWWARLGSLKINLGM